MPSRTLEEWRDIKAQLLAAGNESHESLAQCRCRLHLTRQQAVRIMFGPEPVQKPDRKTVMAERRERVKALYNSMASRKIAEHLDVSLQTIRDDLAALGLTWVLDKKAKSERLRAAAKRNAGYRREAAMRGLEKARSTAPEDKPNPPAPAVVPIATLQACRRMIGNGDRIEHVLQAMNLTIEPQRLRRLINNMR